MAVASLRLPLTASKGLIAEALTPRCLTALTPKGLPRAASFHSCQESLTPKAPTSCSPSVTFDTPKGSSAAVRLLSNGGCLVKPSVTDKDGVVSASFTDMCQTSTFPCLLGRDPMVGAPLANEASVDQGKPPRRVHFDESERQLALNARDAFLARRSRIGMRRS